MLQGSIAVRPTNGLYLYFAWKHKPQRRITWNVTNN